DRHSAATSVGISPAARCGISRGRPSSSPKDPDPTWNGYSTAHWEGDTLVVQTEGFRDSLWIDTWGIDARRCPGKMGSFLSPRLRTSRIRGLSHPCGAKRRTRTF